MAKVRNAANTIRQGRIGENTWYVRDGVQVVRQRLQNSNYGEGARRSSAQQERRAKWGNLVNFYKIIKSWQPKAYESLKKGVTDYNAFMQLNANSTRVYLTRQLVEAGAAVLDTYRISKGTLPSIDLDESEGDAKQNPVVYITVSIAISSTTTVGALSADIIANNENFMDGDNIAFIAFWQTSGGNGLARVSQKYFEFTLDSNSSETLSEAGITFLAKEGNNILFTPTGVIEQSNNGAAVIHTRQVGASLQVSSQSIWVLNSPSSDYTDDTAKAAAIASYGVDGDVPLAPGE
mgnify:CR=1 FL=1